MSFGFFSTLHHSTSAEELSRQSANLSFHAVDFYSVTDTFSIVLVYNFLKGNIPIGNWENVYVDNVLILLNVHKLLYEEHHVRNYQRQGWTSFLITLFQYFGIHLVSLSYVNILSNVLSTGGRKRLFDYNEYDKWYMSGTLRLILKVKLFKCTCFVKLSAKETKSFNNWQLFAYPLKPTVLWISCKEISLLKLTVLKL